MGSGSSIKKMIREEMSSRKMAEAVQSAVGADRRLKEVRHGKFAEEGAIGQEFLPMGTGANMLPAMGAEFEGHEDGTTVDTAISGEDATIMTMQGRKKLKVPCDSAPASFHTPYANPYTGSRWYQYGPDGTTYIYSAHAYTVAGMGNNYVGLRVRAADDAVGTNAVTLYDTPANTTDMWLITGGEGQYERIHCKFTIPAGKPFLRIDYKTLQNTGKYVAFANNMLEVVKDSRSFPSKYAAPTPQTGELSPEQMGFGGGANILPYQKATLSSIGLGMITLNSLVQGYMYASELGYGYYFQITDDGDWSTPMANFGSSNEPYEPNKQYIASCSIKNVHATHTITVTMRVGTANNTSDILTKTGTWEVKATGKSITLAPGESKRLYVKYTHDANGGVGAIGPRIEWRATKVGSPFAQSLRVSDIMLEQVEVNKEFPSKHATPTIGNRDLQTYQIAPIPHIAVLRGTAQSIANGATVGVQFANVLYSGAWPSDTGPVSPQISKTGLYLITFSSEVVFDTASSTRIEFAVRKTSDLVNITDTTFVGVAGPNITASPTVNGSITMRLVGSADATSGDTIGIRVTNGSGTLGRDINNCRLTIQYLGSY